MRRVISRSIWLQLLVTAIAVVGFVLAYEVSMFDSREAVRSAVVDPTRPEAGTPQLFSATAYCKGTTTASGVSVRTGIAASDPSLLPVGSVINVTTSNPKYNGVYTIMDTGPKVQGRLVDLYMWSCHEALAFGRQQIELTVLRLGWNPSASTPSLIDRLFRRREAARRTPAPAAPPPIAPPALPADPVAQISLDEEDGTAAQQDAAAGQPQDVSAETAVESPAAPAAP